MKLKTNQEPQVSPKIQVLRDIYDSMTEMLLKGEFPIEDAQVANHVLKEAYVKKIENLEKTRFWRCNCGEELGWIHADICVPVCKYCGQEAEKAPDADPLEVASGGHFGDALSASIADILGETKVEEGE